MCARTRRSFRALFAHLLEDRAPLVIHCTAGKDRTGFACALILHALGVADDVIAEDYLLTNRFYRRDPSSGTDLPEDVRQVLGSVETSFLAAALRGDPAPTTAISKAISGRGLASDRRSATELRGALSAIVIPRRRMANALRRRFHFGVEVGDDVLECRDRLLDGCDLHQLPAAHRSAAVLQRDNQIPPLLLELNERQTVVR